MNPIKFCKFHGFGNDYIVVEKNELKEISDIGKFTKEICHRNTGVGGDGIALLEKLDGTEADYSCRIINPDGSEAGFSGNGTRCAVAYLHYKHLWLNKYLKLKTQSGIKNYEFLERKGNTFWYLAELGKPKFDLPASPVFNALLEGKTYEPKVVSVSLHSDDDEYISFFYVDVGNPVACFFVDERIESFEQFAWRKIGDEVESFTQAFPERTNVVFIKNIDRQNIEIRIWERGAGETSSSGTCSIAAAVASAFFDYSDRKVNVHAEGGITQAVWREDDEMLITGRADLAFCGEWFEN